MLGSELQLAAQPRGVRVQRTRPYVAVQIPHGFEDARARNGARGVGEQQQREAEFLRRERDGLAPERHFIARRIEQIVAETVARAVARAAHAGAAQQRVDAGEHFGAAHGLADAVVGARLETADDLAFVRRGHQHDGGQTGQQAARVRDELVAALVAAPVGGDQQVEGMVFECRHERGGVLKMPARVAARDEQAFDDFRVTGVGFDKGDSHSSFQPRRAGCACLGPSRPLHSTATREAPSRPFSSESTVVNETKEMLFAAPRRSYRTFLKIPRTNR
ncbi:conserved hypothetical protein [Paraburkholderia tropica]|nr:conserved hypothetical protein [Paraburkholderia tropica]